MNNRIEKACYEIILSSSVLKKEELDKVYSESEASKQSFTELLIQKGLLREAEILALYSKSLGIPMVNLRSVEIEKSLLERVPIKFASYYRFFPIKLNQKRLTIAVSRLLDVNTLDEIRLGVGYEIELALSRNQEIDEMLKRYYGLGAETVQKILSQQSAEETAAISTPLVEELQNIEHEADTASVVKLVNQIIFDAYKRRASDVHIEPFRDKVRLRYRIDGVLHEARVPPELKRFLSSILSRIKIMANLNIVERRLPQDGKARVKTQDQSLDLRISSIPTPLGESMVIRILPSKMIYNLEELGFEASNLAIFKDLIAMPHGIIFVTGPTGSGKSTTLYAGLRELNTMQRKIITIEDPIEYEMEGMTQIQVLPDIGLTFARGLRSMLRHDPDVMMVGEVRDFETADIAIRVALTGHLILSTLHTNDAASGITRLLDIGVEPYLISSSVIGFIAQRLVRVICKHCKIEDQSLPRDTKILIANDLGLTNSESVKVYKGKGCEECFGTGYSSRVAIHEIIPLNEKIRQMISERANADEIRHKVKELGMQNLRQDGWRKVIKGVTTYDEIMQVTNSDEKASEVSEPIPMIERVKIEKPVSVTQSTVDRRKYERVRVKILFSFKIVEGDTTTIDTNDLQLALNRRIETEDISAGGICFVSPIQLSKGSILELKIWLSDKEEPVVCLGRVLRVSRALDSLAPEGRFYYRCAIPFIAINSTDRTRIETLCNSLKGAQ